MYTIIYTSIAATLINCLERSLQITGTVKTNLTFSWFDKTPRELRVLRQ